MGKSTLVEFLQKKLQWTVLHTGGPKDGPEGLEKSFRMVEEVKRPMILDRAPMLSEIAYRPINVEGAEVSEEEQAEYIRRFVGLRPVLIVCRRRALPDIQIVERPHKPIEYWKKVVGGYSGIVQRYDGLVERLAGQVPIYSYDWALPGEPAALEDFLNYYLFPDAEG